MERGSETQLKWWTIKLFNLALQGLIRWITSLVHILTYIGSSQSIRAAGAMVQWLKLPAWKVGGRGFVSRSGIQVSKKPNVSSPFTRKDSILCGASVVERWSARPQTARARISNPVLEDSHLIHLTILRRFSLPNLAYRCTKVVWNPILYHSMFSEHCPWQKWYLQYTVYGVLADSYWHWPSAAQGDGRLWCPRLIGLLFYAVCARVSPPGQVNTRFISWLPASPTFWPAASMAGWLTKTRNAQADSGNCSLYEGEVAAVYPCPAELTWWTHIYSDKHNVCSAVTLERVYLTAIWDLHKLQSANAEQSRMQIQK